MAHIAARLTELNLIERAGYALVTGVAGVYCHSRISPCICGNVVEGGYTGEGLRDTKGLATPVVCVAAAQRSPKKPGLKLNAENA